MQTGTPCADHRQLNICRPKRNRQAETAVPLGRQTRLDAIQPRPDAVLHDDNVVRNEIVVKCRASCHAVSTDVKNDPLPPLSSFPQHSPPPLRSARKAKALASTFHQQKTKAMMTPIEDGMISCLRCCSMQVTDQVQPCSIIVLLCRRLSKASWRATLPQHLLHVGEVHRSAVTTEADVTPTGSLAREEVHQSKGIVVRRHLSECARTAFMLIS